MKQKVPIQGISFTEKKKKKKKVTFTNSLISLHNYVIFIVTPQSQRSTEGSGVMFPSVYLLSDPDSSSINWR